MGLVGFAADPEGQTQKAESSAGTKESYLMLARTGFLVPGIAIFRTENLQCRAAALITPSTNLFSQSL